MPCHHVAALKLKEEEVGSIQNVVEALKGLNGKIDGVIKVLPGLNQSLERGRGSQLGLDIVMSSIDVLAVYGPHPEHAKVKAVLKPKLAGMIVVDFNDDAPVPEHLAGFAHVILLSVKDDATDEQVDTMIAGLKALPDNIESCHSVFCGRNITPGEKAAGFNFGLVVVLDSAESLPIYAKHEYHVKVATTLIKPILNPGGLLALDYPL